MNRLETIRHRDWELSAVGNADLLDRKKTGLLCSRKCPADKILEAYERFKQWAADPSTTVISGFHSPVEKECLRQLIKGKANIIICPAREIEHMRIPADWKPVLDADRMLILSPFLNPRVDRATAMKRNDFIKQLSDDVYVPFDGANG